MSRPVVAWITALVALAVSPAAAAHGGGGALGFRSEVTRITPAVSGVTAVVRDFDDRLQLDNDTGKRLIVLGYEGEPYLAFDGGRVYRNTRSPATYLNDDRFGDVALPPQVDPKATPQWEEVAQEEGYEWHDHRIHWMSRELPPTVRNAKDEPHHVFDWQVPVRLEGRPLVIAGSLDYEPPPDDSPMILIGVLFVIAVGGSTAIWLRRRRERRRPAWSKS